jgi:microcompartment protein CcmK/EutM
MQLARVIGDVVATQKDANLVGIKLLIIQPLTPAREAAGRPVVAVDAVGAGSGEDVFFVRGKEASFPFYPAEPPVDAAVVGIVDHWTVDFSHLAPRTPHPAPGPPHLEAPGTEHQAPGTQHPAPSTRQRVAGPLRRSE